MKLLNIIAGGLLALTLVACQTTGQGGTAEFVSFKGTPYQGEVKPITEPVVIGRGALESVPFVSHIKFFGRADVGTMQQRQVVEGRVAVSAREQRKVYEADIDRFERKGRRNANREGLWFKSAVVAGGRHQVRELTQDGKSILGSFDDRGFLEDGLPLMSPFGGSEKVYAKSAAMLHIGGIRTRCEVVGETVYDGHRSLVVALSASPEIPDVVKEIPLSGYGIIDIESGLWLYSDLWGEKVTDQLIMRFRLLHQVGNEVPSEAS